MCDHLRSSSSEDKASKGSKKAKIAGMYMRELPEGSQKFKYMKCQRAARGRAPFDLPEVQVPQAEEVQVEEGENVQVEAGEDAQVEEGEDAQVEEGEDPRLALANHVVGIVKKQRDQAIQQARHWQATAQKQRAKICKLEAENKDLVEMHDAMGHWMMQDPVMFRQWEQRKNFPPDFQVDPPVPVPKPPVGPPPSYLIRRFQSQTSSSQNVLGLNKANAIGKKVVKKHAKPNWAKAPVPKD